MVSEARAVRDIWTSFVRVRMRLETSSLLAAMCADSCGIQFGGGVFLENIYVTKMQTHPEVLISRSPHLPPNVRRFLSHHRSLNAFCYPDMPLKVDLYQGPGMRVHASSWPSLRLTTLQGLYVVLSELVISLHKTVS